MIEEEKIIDLSDGTIDCSLVSKGEKIVEIKNEVIAALEQLKYGLGFAITEDIKSQIMNGLEELENVQNMNVSLHQLLKEANRKNREEDELQKEEDEKIISDYKLQLEDKEKEIKGLKNEVVNLTKEVERLKTYDKCSEDT